MTISPTNLNFVGSFKNNCDVIRFESLPTYPKQLFYTWMDSKTRCGMLNILSIIEYVPVFVAILLKSVFRITIAVIVIININIIIIMTTLLFVLIDTVSPKRFNFLPATVIIY